jgi:hypothetical protein
LRIDRYLTHALLLAIAVALSGYTRDMDRHFPAYLTARPGPVNAEALVVSAAGMVSADIEKRNDLSIDHNGPVLRHEL